MCLNCCPQIQLRKQWMGMDRLGKVVDDGVHLNVTICGNIPSWSDLK